MIRYKNWRKTNWILLLLFSTLLCSCNARFKVNNEYISTTGERFKGFTMDRINVVNRNESGLPIEYTKEATLWLMKKVNADGERKRGSKKVFFDRVNSDYRWKYINAPDFFEKFPMIFEKNKWYRIWGLEKSGSQDYQIFIHVLENGDFELFDKHTPRI